MTINLKNLKNKLLNEIKKLESREIYDEELSLVNQEQISYYKSLLNTVRFLEYTGQQIGERSNLHTVSDGEDVFRLSNEFYDDYEAAEKIILENDIQDIRLEAGQVLRINNNI